MLNATAAKVQEMAILCMFTKKAFLSLLQNKEEDKNAVLSYVN